MNSYMQTGSSGILIMGIVLLLAAAIIYSFMYSIPRNVKRIADTLEVQNAAIIMSEWRQRIWLLRRSLEFGKDI